MTVTAPATETLMSEERPLGCSTMAYSASPAGVQLRPFTAPSKRMIVGALEAPSAIAVSPGVKYARREPLGAQRGSAVGGIKSLVSLPPLSAYHPVSPPTAPSRARAPVGSKAPS